MDAKDLVEIGMKEEDITTMLFGKKVIELTEDAFYGSKEERKIFEELFCRTGTSGASTRHPRRDGKSSSLRDASKELISTNTPSSSASNHKSARCRVVESFTYGNLSSYLVFCNNDKQKMQKTVGFPDMASASDLVIQWTPPSVERVYTRRAVARRNQRAKLCSVLDLERVDITSVKQRRDRGQHKYGHSHAVLWDHLRLHANLLMMDAGWKIDGKERWDKSKVDHIYESPDKVMRLFSLPRAWKCFGQWLLINSSGFGGNDYGRIWFNIHDFLSDLKNTLLCLEYEVRLPKQSLSCLNQWQLLDPFMAVVCIDKKVRALKKGVALKAVNSTVTFVSCIESKLSNPRNADNPLGLNHSSNFNSTHPRSRKNLLPLLQSDDLDGNSSRSKHPSTVGKRKSSQYKMDERLPIMAEIQEKSIRSTAHRIVMGLQDSTAFPGSRTSLNMKNKPSYSKSNLTQSIQDKSDPLYFPPNYSPSDLVENAEINDPSFHAYDMIESANVDNSADSPDELLLGANLLFSHEVDEMLLDDISNEHYCTAAVSEPQAKNIDLEDGPSGPSSVVSEKDTCLKANKDVINNEQHDDGVVAESQLANTDVMDRPAGAPSFLPTMDTVLEGNEMSSEEMTKGGQLSCEGTNNAMVISEPQLLFVSPHDGTLSFMNDSMCSQEMQSCLNASNGTMGTNVQLGIQSSVYEASLIRGFLYLDNEGSPICWTVLNPEPPRQLICSEPISKASELHGEMNMECGMLTSGPKQTSKLDSSKNNRKRSKKAANIEDKGSQKKQKVNDVPVSYCAIGQYMDHITENPAGCLISNDKEQIGSASTEQVSLNLLPGNSNDMNQQVPVKNSDNDQARVRIGSAEKIVPEKTPKKDVKRQKASSRHKCKFDDNDLLVTAVIHKLTARYRNRFSRRLAKKSGFKRLPRCRWKSEERRDRKTFPKGARTVLGKLLEMGIVCKVNILQYRRPGSKNVLKDGNITKKGIRCRCCDKVFTMSMFKYHAGLRQEIPSLNLFLGSGKSYTLCQLQAWSIEHKARKERAKCTMPLQADENDDTCGLCGDGGELICCDNCPASYHQDCLPCQDIPDGSWYCYSCLCDICGEVINLKELRSSLPALECAQCERQYHAKCIYGKLLCNEEGGPCAWFCGRRCQQIYMNLRSRVGIPIHTIDGFSCTVLRNNGDQRVSTAADIAILAECNMKLVIALSIMEECFLPIIDARTGIDIIPPILYNWRSDFVHLDYKGFYTVVLENDDRIISVASMRLHGTVVAEMPLIATCLENHQQGMCRRLMDYIEQMLKSLKVEMLLLSAIPSLVDTWTMAFGFVPIDDLDRKNLSRLRLVSVPGTVILKRNLYECPGTNAGELRNPEPFKVYSRSARKNRDAGGGGGGGGGSKENLAFVDRSVAVTAADAGQQRPFEDRSPVSCAVDSLADELRSLKINSSCENRRRLGKTAKPPKSPNPNSPSSSPATAASLLLRRLPRGRPPPGGASLVGLSGRNSLTVGSTCHDKAKGQLVGSCKCCSKLLIQGLERLQAPSIEKAWRSLRNTQVARKNYLRPGLSGKVKDCDSDHAHTYGTSSSYNVNKMDSVSRNRNPTQESMHQTTESGTMEKNSSHLPAGTKSCTRTYLNNHVVQADTITTTNQSLARTGPELFKTAPFIDNMCDDAKLDAMDEDELLASIDVDRIVMEHYQATNTPRGSSKSPLEKCNFNGFDENNLPQELSIIYTEGSGDKQWSSTHFAWTKELEANNKRVFGNRSFRPNQREIINATMSGNDLPALICNGVTLVVSPLVSLIQDQIMHLLQANISAAYLSASMEWSEQQEILRELMSPTCTYKLLYVTPEKIAKSDALLRQLENLYSRGHLSRIVIDEAHCVSQWGHDFRPDYQHLGILKQKFPQTPVLALTATATASVKEDVVQVLGLANCIIFRQSFNRPNLRYFVWPKTKKCLEDIHNFIHANHNKECGIIYCLSRMDCEKVAAKLREYGHKASHYHGSMDPEDRANIQKQWSKDRINIICATVAFGMGINKPDVRFVIHHSLPKSIEGYHQECGRAGRDSQLSSCVLFYNYSDYIRLKHMVTQGFAEQGTSAPRGGSSQEQALETHKENLLRMVSYCENDVDCRRLLQLIHFGEMFNPSCCAKTCDNCLKELRWVEKDVTNIARQLVDLVMMTKQTYSTTHILEVYRGSVNQNVKKHRHDTLSLHGAGKHLAKGEAARILRHLVIEEILIEDVKKSENYGSVSSVLKTNHKKSGDLLSGKHNVVLKFPTPEKAPKMGVLDESSVPRINKTNQQSQVDGSLAAELYEALQCLRTQIMDENPQLLAYHIFKNETLKEISNRMPRTKEELVEINGIGKNKLNKYGDRVLATIEDFLARYPNATRKTSSGGSNEHSEAVKKRRGFSVTNTSTNCDDFEERTVQSKKRAAKTRTRQEISDAASIVQDVRYIDLELDGCEQVNEVPYSVQKPVASGRVLPAWQSARIA
uniref:DNA 3'-5' helicase n=1 Tax=Oryza meridionalis TaxID=40149 RepID=A0A0E0DEF4_9ORYZ